MPPPVDTSLLARRRFFTSAASGLGGAALTWLLAREQAAAKESDPARKVTTPYIAPGCTSVYAQYTIEVANRAAVEEGMKKRGVPTAVHYPVPLHLQPVFAGCRSYGGGVSARLFDNGLCIPSGSSMTEDQRQQVIEGFRALFPG